MLPMSICLFCRRPWWRFASYFSENNGLRKLIDLHPSALDHYERSKFKSLTSCCSGHPGVALPWLNHHQLTLQPSVEPKLTKSTLEPSNGYLQLCLPHPARGSTRVCYAVIRRDGHLESVRRTSFSLAKSVKVYDLRSRVLFTRASWRRA